MPRLLIALLIITAAIYFPGLSGGFYFDDAWNIESNSSIKISSLDLTSLTQVISSGESGPLKRPISMMSFAINYYFSGPDPFYFKLTNLLIHLLNGLALFFLTQSLLSTYKKYKQPDLPDKSIAWISLAVTAAWLIHPLNLTSILYIVQRMNSLSALFVISGLLLYTRGRQQLALGEGGFIQIISSVLLFFPLAILSKENGALLPILILAIEISFFRFQAKTKKDKNFLITFFSITALLPFILGIGYLTLHPERIVNGYLTRDFTLYERLLTESRIIWSYIQMIILPIGQNYGLFHDDIIISRGLTQPISSLFSIFGIIALIALAIWTRVRAPLITFAILFFLIGHSMESTIIGLELVHEHRNYLPQYGILLVLFYYLIYPPKFINKFKFHKAIPVLFLVGFAITTTMRASAWSTQEGFSLEEISSHPNSPRANYQIGRIYATAAEKTRKTPRFDYFFNLASKHFTISSNLKNNYTDGLFALLILHSSNNKTIDTKSFLMLRQRLAESPITANSINQIRNLVRCHQAGACNIEGENIIQLLKATLSNPTLKGKSRAIVLIAMSNYYSSQPNHYPEAISAIQQAINIRPKNPTYTVKLTDLYIKSGESEKARKFLKLSKKLDVWNKHTSDIHHLEKLLQKNEFDVQNNVTDNNTK